jgi:hypothetical protein
MLFVLHSQLSFLHLCDSRCTPDLLLHLHILPGDLPGPLIEPLIILEDLSEEYNAYLLALPEHVLNDLAKGLHLVGVHEVLVRARITGKTHEGLNEV